MKNDIRLTYPLWMMAFVALFGAFAYGIHSPTMTKTETSFMLEIGGLEGFVLLTSLLLYLILLTIFLVKVTKHNKENPKQKLAIWSIRPPEYLEQDEGMTHITRVAVQKVYTFYTWSLPLLYFSYYFAAASISNHLRNSCCVVWPISYLLLGNSQAF